jgi:uncharacterized membrane protein YGL010W
MIHIFTAPTLIFTILVWLTIPGSQSHIPLPIADTFLPLDPATVFALILGGYYTVLHVILGGSYLPVLVGLNGLAHIFAALSLPLNPKIIALIIHVICWFFQMGRFFFQ